MKFDSPFFLYTLGIILFLIVYFPYTPLESNDYVFHYSRSLGYPTNQFLEYYSLELFNRYDVLSDIISAPFSLFFGTAGFNAFWFVFLFVLFPVTLFLLLNKNYFIFPIYYSTCTIFFYWHSFTIAQLLFTYFLVLFAFCLKDKKYLLAVLLLPFIILSHNDFLYPLLLLILTYLAYKVIIVLYSHFKSYFINASGIAVLGSLNPFEKSPLLVFVKFVPLQLIFFLKKISFMSLFFFASVLIAYFSNLFGFDFRVVFTGIPFLLCDLSDSFRDNDYNNLNHWVVVFVLFFTFVMNLFF